jgi:hypothetical protein
MKNPGLIDGTNLDVGSCIYCGRNDLKLTREHVMPRGLGGNWAPDGMSDALVLQNASCESCRKITQNIEEQCLVGMMDPARARLGLKRKDRFSDNTVANLKRVDGTKEDREVDWTYVPGSMVLPSFHTAGFFAGRQFYNELPCDHKLIIARHAKPYFDQDVKGVGVSMTSNPKLFAQMLSKIALGMAVACVGLKNIKPSVRDIILKGGEGYGYYVGGYANNKLEETKTESMHSVKMHTFYGPTGAYLIVNIRLFAEHGGPTNYVVAGRLV